MGDKPSPARGLVVAGAIGAAALGAVEVGPAVIHAIRPAVEAGIHGAQAVAAGGGFLLEQIGTAGRGVAGAVESGGRQLFEAGSGFARWLVGGVERAPGQAAEADAQVAALHLISPNARVSGAGSDVVRVEGLHGIQDLQAIETVVRTRASYRLEGIPESTEMRCTVTICPGVTGPTTITGECRDASATASTAGTLTFGFEADGRSMSVAFGLEAIEITYGRSFPGGVELERQHSDSGKGGAGITPEKCEFREFAKLGLLLTLRDGR